MRLARKTRCFVLLESSHYRGKFGRFFVAHIRREASQWRGSILSVIELPSELCRPGNSSPAFEPIFEAATVVKIRKALYVLLGERSEGMRPGSLWSVPLEARGTIEADTITFVMDLLAPQLSTREGSRHCTALEWLGDASGVDELLTEILDMQSLLDRIGRHTGEALQRR